MPRRNTLYFDLEEASTRRLNLEKKQRPCLGCGKMLRTRRGRRFCRVCLRRNQRNRYYLPKTASLPDWPIEAAESEERPAGP